MKKIFFLLFIIPAFSIAQYVGADFIVLNEGKESDYHQLEKVWKAYHQKSVDSGEKIGWSVWKRTPRENDNENAAHYVVFNQFSSKEQMEDLMKNWSMNKAISIMKTGMKGKMSSKSVDRIVKNGDRLKKQVRQYTIQLIDATPLTGGNLKIGDKMYFGTMRQKSDDYEKYETEVWKPVFEREILRNNHRWWAITKIEDRNELAYQNPTHFVWNIPIKDAKPFIQEEDYKSSKLQSMMDDFREMSPASELTLVYLTD